MGELDHDVIAIGLDFGRGHATLDGASERFEMILENSLRFILREAALELARAIETIMTVGAEFYHARTVHPRIANMLGRIDKRPQEADAVQDFKRAGLNGGRAGLAVRLHVALDEAGLNAMAGELCRGKYAGRTCADD